MKRHWPLARPMFGMFRLAVLFVVIGGLILVHASPASAFSTGAIADEAERYPNGSHQGQCIVFVAKVLRDVSGGSINISAYAHGYQGTFSANGARQVSSSEAGRGDIIQVTPAGTSDSWKGPERMPLHTAIITQNLGGGNFNVIDSNWSSTNDELVRRHSLNPYSWAASKPGGGIVKIWRFGSSGSGNADPIGHYDSASSPEPGAVRVGGWSFDPSSPHSAVTIHAYVGGTAGSGAEGHALGPASRGRPDVGRAYPSAGSAHGFDFVFSTNRVGSLPVCVYAIDIGAGSNKSLGCKTVRVADPRPAGAVDVVKTPSAGTVRVAGWLFDPNEKTEPLNFHVYVGGEAGQSGAEGHALGPADGHRADVGRKFPGVGDYHGFDTTFETKKVGSQNVCVYGINVGRGSNRLLECHTVEIADPSPTGRLDTVASPAPGRVAVTGWTFDRNDLDRAIDYHIYIGGRAGQPGVEGHGAELPPAGASRPDVDRHYPGVGSHHGIAVTVPTRKSGLQEVCIYGINVGPGSNRLLECGKVVIAPDTVAPETSISKHPAKRVRAGSHARKLSFGFASSEGYSTFECKVKKDRKRRKHRRRHNRRRKPQWNPCGQSAQVRVSAKRRGARYALWVRAIDYAGNTDATPARYRWRVIPR